MVMDDNLVAVYYCLLGLLHEFGDLYTFYPIAAGFSESQIFESSTETVEELKFH